MLRRAQKMQALAYLQLELMEIKTHQERKRERPVSYEYRIGAKLASGKTWGFSAWSANREKLAHDAQVLRDAGLETTLQVRAI